VNCGPWSNFLYIAITIYFTHTVYFFTYYYYFSLDTLNPLFTANQWDWQPHHKLGAKFLVVLCAGSTLLLVQSKALDEAPYKLSGAVAKLAGITFRSLAFSYWFDKSRFLIEGKTCCCAHHTFLLGFPTGWSSTSTPHRNQPPLLALIWEARSWDPVQVSYRWMRTLITLELHGLRVAILFLGCSRYANSEDPRGRILVNWLTLLGRKKVMINNFSWKVLLRKLIL
jgi:hypothetical protein